jgi:molybdopterin-guanine dinucleotide biosynthesis protein A
VVDGWVGAVLTGGASTRMGRDKALLPIDGVAMARRVADALRAAGASEVVAIGGDELALVAEGLDVVADDHPGDGPLAGVLTALRWAAPRRCLVAPCDLVDPDPATFAALVAGLDVGEVDACVPEVDGGWRPLPAAFAPSSSAVLCAAFEHGERAVHRALAGCVFVPVRVTALADADEPGDLPAGR